MVHPNPTPIAMQILTALPSYTAPVLTLSIFTQTDVAAAVTRALSLRGCACRRNSCWHGYNPHASVILSGVGVAISLTPAVPRIYKFSIAGSPPCRSTYPSHHPPPGQTWALANLHQAPVSSGEVKAENAF